MIVDNPAALRFILQDEVYLLPQDKTIADKIIPETAPVIIAEPVTETPPLKLNYLGKHAKAFLVVVHYPEHEFIAADHLTALENILKRKEYAINDVAIFNIAANAVDINELLTYFNPEKLLVLGQKALPANMEAITLHQPKQLATCMALYSFSFDEMMSSNDNKRIFWDQMKTL